MGELADQPEESFTAEYVLCHIPVVPYSPMHIRERREHRVFRLLVQMVPGLEERLVNSTEAEVRFIAELVRALPIVL
jgi:hypothetical protein